MKRLLFCILLMTLAGCATPLQPNQTRITFDSYPPGARISTATTNYGTAPVALTWVFKNERLRDTSELITATWISGAQSATRMRLIAGQEATYTFNRPQGMAGLDVDVQWAASLQRTTDSDKANTEAALRAYLLKK